jgi:hypothetical protein
MRQLLDGEPAIEHQSAGGADREFLRLTIWVWRLGLPWLLPIAKQEEIIMKRESER